MNYDPLFETALPVVVFLLIALYLALKAVLWDMPRWVRDALDVRRANQLPPPPSSDLRQVYRRP